MALKSVITRCQIIQKNCTKFGNHRRLRYLKNCIKIGCHKRSKYLKECYCGYHRRSKYSQEWC